MPSFKHKGHGVPANSLRPGNALVEPTDTTSVFSFLRHVRKFTWFFIHSTILLNTHNVSENIPELWKY